MKLSAAQQKVISEAKADIDLARSCSTYKEYWTKTSGVWETKTTFEETVANDPWWHSEMERYWRMHQDGVAFVHCSGRTLESLRKAGVIEIVIDSTGFTGYGIDHIRIVNY